MLTRDWILETLAMLPVWTWPVFFWDVWWFERYYRAYRAATHTGMIGIGVTTGGRIVITLQVAGDRETPEDWRTRLAHEPWARLAPAASFAPAGPRSGFGPDMDCFWTVSGLPLDGVWTVVQPARALAPP